MIALLALGITASLPARNLVNHLNSSESSSDPYDSQHRFAAVAAWPGSYEVPTIARAQGELSDDHSVITSQDSTALDSKRTTSRKVDPVVNPNMLRKPSVHRKIQVSAKGQPYEIDHNSFQSGLARISAAYRKSGKAGKSSN